VLVALVPDERRSSTLNSLAGMVLGLAGGCTFPRESLPAFVRDHLTPLLPSYWFVNAAAGLTPHNSAWTLALLKLAIAGALVIALAGALFRRRFRTGARA